MSLLRTGLLRQHYEEAREDVEYKSSAFWQAILRRAFWELDVYSVTAGSSPDEALRRVDGVVERYDEASNSLFALLWVECKRPSGSVQEVENHARDAATRCIQKYDLTWIWAMTTIGTSFRMWFIDRESRALRPVHGTPVHGTFPLGDRTQYIDADSPAVSVFPYAIQLVKDRVPLLVPRVVPSQNTVAAGASLLGQAESHYDHDRMEAGPSGDGGDEYVFSFAKGRKGNTVGRMTGKRFVSRIKFVEHRKSLQKDGTD